MLAEGAEDRPNGQLTVKLEGLREARVLEDAISTLILPIGL